MIYSIVCLIWMIGTFIMPIYITCNKKKLSDIPIHEKILAVPFWFIIVEAYAIFGLIKWYDTIIKEI